MNKLTKVNIVLIIVVLILIGFLFYTIMWMKKETRECLTSPLTFSIGKLSEEFGEEIYCYCNKGITLNSTTISKTNIVGGE